MCFPQGILENAIKITNEPPTGMHANLHAALDNFDQVSVDGALCATSARLFLHCPIGLFLGHPGPVQPGAGV